jgi:hypothetical protein
MPADPWFQTLFADRIGGAAYGDWVRSTRRPWRDTMTSVVHPAGGPS